MQIIPAKQVNRERMEQFLKNNDTLDGNALRKKGYMVTISEEIQGCFILDEMQQSGEYWLKQLYITRDHANKLPVLLETILALAKTKQAKSVYVHSHQPVVDILLEAMQFHPKDGEVLVDKNPIPKGKWWYYQVS